MADSKQAPLDAEAAAKAAFASVQDKPFPNDIFTAPELRWAVIGCGIIANQMAQSLALAGRKLAGVANRTLSKAQAFAEQTLRILSDMDLPHTRGDEPGV